MQCPLTGRQYDLWVLRQILSNGGVASWRMILATAEQRGWSTTLHRVVLAFNRLENEGLIVFGVPRQNRGASPDRDWCAVGYSAERLREWPGRQRGRRVSRAQEDGWDEENPGFENAVRVLEDG